MKKVILMGCFLIAMSLAGAQAQTTGSEDGTGNYNYESTNGLNEVDAAGVAEADNKAEVASDKAEIENKAEVADKAEIVAGKAEVAEIAEIADKAEVAADNAEIAESLKD
jgi:hypothetical protein